MQEQKLISGSVNQVYFKSTALYNFLFSYRRKTICQSTPICSVRAVSQSMTTNKSVLMFFFLSSVCSHLQLISSECLHTASVQCLFFFIHIKYFYFPYMVFFMCPFKAIYNKHVANDSHICGVYEEDESWLGPVLYFRRRAAL